MTLKINDECINCDVCEPACPNQAIVVGQQHYEILVDKCTECMGHYESPMCLQLCPLGSECIESI